MKKRKRILAVLLAGAMVAGLSACGGSGGEADSGSDGGSIDEAGYNIDDMEVEETTVKLYHRIDPNGGDAESSTISARLRSGMPRITETRLKPYLSRKKQIISTGFPRTWRQAMRRTSLCSTAEQTAWIM